MKNQESPQYDEMRSEYEIVNPRPNPYAEKMRSGSNLVLIDPDIFQVFSSSDAVNRALRLLIEAARSADNLPKAS